MLKNIAYGFAAGICISLGGAVFLNCDNRIAGSILFAVALTCICRRGYYLFTGKVGFLAESCKKDDLALVLGCLVGNTLATVAGGLLIGYAVPNCAAVAETLCSGKLGQAAAQTFIRAFFCGTLMYLAVSIYRDKKSADGIYYCVPVFILSGFEHSIADIFYFAAAHDGSAAAVRFLVIVLLGNSLGGLCLPLLEKVGGQKNA